MYCYLLLAIEEEGMLQNVHELHEGDSTADVSPALKERDEDFVSIVKVKSMQRCFNCI